MKKTEINKIRSLFEMEALPIGVVKKIEQFGVDKIKLKFDQLCATLNAVKANNDMRTLITEAHEIHNFTVNIEEKLEAIRQDTLEHIDSLVVDITNDVEEKLNSCAGAEDWEVAAQFDQENWWFFDSDSVKYCDELLESVLRVVLVRESKLNELSKPLRPTYAFNRLPKKEQEKALELLEEFKKKGYRVSLLW